MRVSVKRDDPGYTPAPHAFVVFFNGEEQTLERTGRCIITADEEAGVIVFNKGERTSSGIRFEIEGDEFKTFTLQGVVRVEQRMPLP